MAFDKKLLPEGAITLPEFMEKHDPKEVENYRVSYLLPDGKPLEYKGNRLEGIGVEVLGDSHRLLRAYPFNSGANLLASEAFDWRVTRGWGDQVTSEIASDSVIAVLDYHEPESKHGSVGKSPQEWLEMPGFNAEWFEGARFEGCEHSLTRDPRSKGDLSTQYDWSCGGQVSVYAWMQGVSYPWRKGTPLYLTVENEAKALANSEPERVGEPVGKSVREWLATEGFDPEWLEGARFKGYEGHLVRDLGHKDLRIPDAWDSSRNPGNIDAWSDDIYTPWRLGDHLYLTAENEEKALANSKPGRVGKTADEWMEIEGFNPLWFEGGQFEGRKAHLVRDHGRPSNMAAGWDSSRDPGFSDAWRADVLNPWHGGVRLYLTPENETKALALLGDHKPERFGKTADEWLEIDGFDPRWLEGGQFEGQEGCLTLGVENNWTPTLPGAWNAIRLHAGPDGDQGELLDWGRGVRDPWIYDHLLYLTPENEAKALALPGASGEEWRERREEGFGTSEIEGDEQHEAPVQKTIAEWGDEEHFKHWMLEGARFVTSTGCEVELVLHSSARYTGSPNAWHARLVATGEPVNWREVELLFNPHLSSGTPAVASLRETNYHALLRAQGKMPWAS